MRVKYVVAGLVLLVLAGLVGLFLSERFGPAPALIPPREDIAEIFDNLESDDEITSENETEFPLSIPPGFKISIFAKDLPKARVMAFDGRGNLWVSQTRNGAISLLEIENGEVVSHNQIFRNLNNPHGLAFDPDNPFMLYIAEEDEVSRIPVYTDAPLESLFALPAGDGHFTRTIEFYRGELLTSVGSSCNVCEENDGRRAKILVSDKDGSSLRDFATGLRNSVFMAFHPETDELWATENGRDLLGDDIPPDEINIVREGQSYGWPICYGKNIHDTQFDKNTYIRPPCTEPFEQSSHVELQAHSAPLGLAFVPQTSNWPEEYKNDLIVAYHGSWNRSVPTGYKLVRIKLDESGNYLETEDFISGWLQGVSALGRPVDVLFGSSGEMLVSDDHAGVIYKIEYEG